MNSGTTPPPIPPQHFSQLPAGTQLRLELTWATLLTESDPPAIRQLAEQQPEQLLKILACSDFAAQQCLRQPQYLADLLESGRLLRTSDSGEIAAVIEQAFAGITDEKGLQSQLREVRNREMLRIAWRDLADLASLEETMADLSQLADQLLAQSLGLLEQWLVIAKGQPLDRAGAPIHLTVLAFGKLGGNELNFSSDIDLVFAYAEEGQIESPKTLSHSQFFQQLAGKLVHCIGDLSAGGLIFRVDTRLRPFGSSGPLAISFDAMEQYYELHGREWERYALIKARPVGHDPAGTALLTRLRPFMYRRYLDFGVIEALREMKQMILDESRQKGSENNIKLGRGGIREVEFLAQAQQLIWGGRETNLQTPRLRTALQRLKASNHLPPTVVDELLESYQFLRRLEHRLQMRRDQQTHAIPTDREERELLALSMNQPSWDKLAEALTQHLDRTHNHFRNLTAFEAATDQTPPVTDDWRRGLEDEESPSGDFLDHCGFRERSKTIDLLRGLLRSSHYRLASSAAQARLDRLMPELLRRTGALPAPDETLARLIHLLEAILRRSAYLSLLHENPQALEQVVRLTASSPWIANRISTHPVLLDELIDPNHLRRTPTRIELQQSLDTALGDLSDTELDHHMTQLREIRHGAVLRVAAAEISGQIQLRQAGEALTEIAETMLVSALKLAGAHLQIRHGTPGLSQNNQPAELLALGFGKLGSQELGYFSDLDLVFLRDDHESESDGASPLSSGRYFARQVQRAIHILATPTAAGRVYEIDMRLRPDGDSGALVSPLEGFAHYQRELAWSWEHLALVRARPIELTPGSQLGIQFEEIRREILSRKRDPGLLGPEVRAMREKMAAAAPPHATSLFQTKLDRGGLVDIEFITQYLVLAHASELPGLTHPRHTLDLLTASMELGLIQNEDGHDLIDAYHQLLGQERKMALQQQKPLVPAEEWSTLSGRTEQLFDKLIPGA
ncbi:MAG: bifunctional [glutamate--ammonia ligase]-adenylyl-L-tyrosine phosphorylase/[glutamate--ammonia-ligase] adenylyltransferase [Gammaproteobacteria bacterium]|nr:bifunctional [glutamate--ammonia ligase]-adenylyl-L-tyrosine phosphorylase/[glutamate--ammonia-ligase] adenylyltransferase [Gammaproteobacteria bacterium]